MSDLQFLDALIPHDASLSRLSRLPPKKSGQSKPNRDAVSRVSRLVPTENNEVRAENEQSPASAEGGEQEKQSAAEMAFALGYLECWRTLFYLGVLVYQAQHDGHECNGCQHQTMTTERHPGTRRKFFWRCELGHVQLETGHGGERIIIAPDSCADYAHANGAIASGRSHG
jgi:hypothetical protein